MKKILISIPEPCHENWDAMTPADKGKFCNACQKTVIDFSQMSDAQLASFLRKPKGSTCGSFHPDQLGRQIAVPRKSLPWIKYFFQIAIPAFLISMKGQAQKAVKTQCGTEKYDGRTMGKMRAAEIVTPFAVTGVVVDTSGKVISNASIQLNISGRGVISDSTGYFEIVPSTKDSYFTVTAIGYEDAVCKFDDRSMRVVLQEKIRQMEEVVITSISDSWSRMAGGYMWSVERTPEVPIITRITDSISPAFLIYPNPAKANSTLSLEIRRLDKGEYVVALFDSKGAAIKSSNLVLSDKQQIAGFQIGNVPAGNYIICLSNKRTGKQHIKKLIVQ